MLQIQILDRIGGPAREGTHGAGWGIGAVLRKVATTDHEHVGDVPRLQVLVDGARRGVRARDRAADVVRALVRNDAVLGRSGVRVMVARLAGFRRKANASH